MCGNYSKTCIYSFGYVKLFVTIFVFGCDVLLFGLQEDSKVFGHARYLDQFFEQQLRKWLPQYTLGLTMATNAALGTETPAGAAAADHSPFMNAAPKRPRSTIDVDEQVLA